MLRRILVIAWFHGAVINSKEGQVLRRSIYIGDNWQADTLDDAAKSNSERRSQVLNTTVTEWTDLLTQASPYKRETCQSQSPAHDSSLRSRCQATHHRQYPSHRIEKSYLMRLRNPTRF